MQTPDDIRTTQAKRFAYLKFLYDHWFTVSSGNLQGLHASVVDDALGLTSQEGDRIHTYLEDRGLIKFVGFGPTLAITSVGIDYVESALASPDEKSEFFPPVNILNIESVTNSQIQQGTAHSTQTAQWAGIGGDELRKLTHEIREEFSAMALSHEHRQDVDAHLGTLEAQTGANKPNHLIVRESLKSLRSIAEQTGAGYLAAKLIEILGAAAL